MPMPAAGGSTPAWLVGGLDDVEHALLDWVRTADPFLNEVAGHLITAGGKRVRPTFAVASARASGGPGDPATGRSTGEAAVLGGVAVELVHLGSLYHDDVIDEATTRRTVESVNARWGNLTAILAGDFLLAKASEIAASLGTEVAGLLAATIGRLCEGEVAELRTAYDVSRSEAAYLQSVKGKTASLFATACRIGAIVAGASRDAVDALTEFGEHYGIAFQIVDDVLDVVATDAELGKPSGHDLVEGVYTLPVLRALAGSQGGELKALLGHPLSDEEREQARALVRADGAVDSALADVGAHITRAVAALESLPGAGDAGAVAWLAASAEALPNRVPR